MSLLIEKKNFPEPKYKVFVSYRHSREDQEYRDHLEETLMANQDVVLMKPAPLSGIDHTLDAPSIPQKIREAYLKDSTVTIVLIGAETWQQKNVDWEIGASLGELPQHSKSGLIGIILPTYHPEDRTQQYNPHTIPPRLYDNVKCGYAAIYDWETDPFIVQKWIHDAYERRNQFIPDNSRPTFTDDLLGERWR